jgi:hypothetical protein
MITAFASLKFCPALLKRCVWNFGGVGVCIKINTASDVPRLAMAIVLCIPAHLTFCGGCLQIGVGYLLGFWAVCSAVSLLGYTFSVSAPLQHRPFSWPAQGR